MNRLIAAALSTGLVVACPNVAIAGSPVKSMGEDPRSPLEPVRVSEPLPPSGAGMRTGGIFMLADGGLRMITGIFVLATVPLMRDSGEATDNDIQILKAVGYATMGIGVLEAGGGGALLGVGLKRKRKFMDWQTRNQIRVPKDGNGMLVGGGISLGFAAFQGANVGIVTDVTGEVPVLNVVLLGAWAAVGISLISVGAIRHANYKGWRERQGLTLTPYGGPTRGGGTVGLVGRF